MLLLLQSSNISKLVHSLLPFVRAAFFSERHINYLPQPQFARTLNCIAERHNALGMNFNFES
jgi:hypothetical protein